MSSLLRSFWSRTSYPVLSIRYYTLMRAIRQYSVIAIDKTFNDGHMLSCQPKTVFKGNPDLTLPTYTIIKDLHTTPKRRINPLVWAIVKPLGKLWSVFWGRALRNWWKKLPDDKRQHYKELFKGLKKFIYSFAVLLLVGLGINFAVHYEENPFTGRYRFISMNNEQLSKIAQYQTDGLIEEHKDKLLDVTTPLYKAVHRCMSMLVKCNQEVITQHGPQMWKLHVINDPDIENAYVLPDGSVFVFAGLIKEMENMDQLAVIISHEMAHVLMKHSAESLSKAQILDYFVIVTMAAIWIIIPNDGIAAITTWFYEKLRKYMIDLPFSRELEAEADKVGLELAARACFDIREAPVLWSLHDARSKQNDDHVPAFLSTHPTSADRAEKLLNRMEHCLKLRRDAGCAEIKTPDPMLRLEKQLAATPPNKDSLSKQPTTEQTGVAVASAQK